MMLGKGNLFGSVGVRRGLFIWNVKNYFIFYSKRYHLCINVVKIHNYATALLVQI